MNVAIYVALAESSGYATEALGNVRTVKAMSTELQGTKPDEGIGFVPATLWHWGMGVPASGCRPQEA